MSELEETSSRQPARQPAQGVQNPPLEQVKGNAGWQKRIASFFGHPASMTFVSFLLTGLIGSLLTVRWQHNEWNRQQYQQVRLHRIEESYKIRDDVIAALARNQASLRSIVYRLMREPQMSNKERLAVAAQLRESRSEWDAAAEVLRQKIRIYFSGTEIADAFDQFIMKRRITTYPQIEASIYDGLGSPDYASQWNEHTLAILNDESQALTKLMQRMSEAAEQSYGGVFR
jgi:hypothetical protein